MYILNQNKVQKHIKNSFLVMLFFLVIVSCNGSNIDILFHKLVSIEKNQDFVSNNTYPKQNTYYKQIYEMGKINNDFLLEQSYSNQITNWKFALYDFKITVGDIAISLILDINEITDTQIKKILPFSISEEFEGSGFIVILRWLHDDDENRKNFIINLKRLL